MMLKPNCPICLEPMTLVKDEKVEIWVCEGHYAESVLDLSWYFQKLKQARIALLYILERTYDTSGGYVWSGKLEEAVKKAESSSKD